MALLKWGPSCGLDLQQEFEILGIIAVSTGLIFTTIFLFGVHEKMNYDDDITSSRAELNGQRDEEGEEGQEGGDGERRERGHGKTEIPRKMSKGEIAEKVLMQGYHAVDSVVSTALIEDAAICEGEVSNDGSSSSSSSNSNSHHDRRNLATEDSLEAPLLDNDREGHVKKMEWWNWFSVCEFYAVGWTYMMT